MNFNNPFPLDYTNDGGDSTVRVGILLICGKATPEILSCIHQYEIKPGIFTRHPSQTPWCNPNNWSRDQMLPFVAGLSAIGEIMPIRRFFWKCARRFFFMQNFERDHAGSKKYPWPHFFTDEFGHKNFHWFDFADPLLPQHIWHIIVAGRMWWFYWFAPLGYLFLLIDLIVHSVSSFVWEENQMIAMCFVQGRLWLRLYNQLCPRWHSRNRKYWQDRHQPEYAEMLEGVVWDG